MAINKFRLIKSIIDEQNRILTKIDIYIENQLKVCYVPDKSVRVTLLKYPQEQVRLELTSRYTSQGWEITFSPYLGTESWVELR